MHQYENPTSQSPRRYEGHASGDDRSNDLPAPVRSTLQKAHYATSTDHAGIDFSGWCGLPECKPTNLVAYRQLGDPILYQAFFGNTFRCSSTQPILDKLLALVLIVALFVTTLSVLNGSKWLPRPCLNMVLEDDAPEFQRSCPSVQWHSPQYPHLPYRLLSGPSSNPRNRDRNREAGLPRLIS